MNTCYDVSKWKLISDLQTPTQPSDEFLKASKDPSSILQFYFFIDFFFNVDIGVERFFGIFPCTHCWSFCSRITPYRRIKCVPIQKSKMLTSQHFLLKDDETCQDSHWNTTLELHSLHRCTRKQKETLEPVYSLSWTLDTNGPFSFLQSALEKSLHRRNDLITVRNNLNQLNRKHVIV